MKTKTRSLSLTQQFQTRSRKACRQTSPSLQILQNAIANYKTNSISNLSHQSLKACLYKMLVESQSLSNSSLLHTGV
ncbi:hypothetical protein [Brunnivagina elsteri]|uniref:hypothetical protein n=1 Tax=Brunnivagina elsteri TaxID=1247191 RepID=UPI001B80803A|nr:hypothetical protein [Calothrix elsteri]